jgi:hypothetical protein
MHISDLPWMFVRIIASKLTIDRRPLLEAVQCTGGEHDESLHVHVQRRLGRAGQPTTWSCIHAHAPISPSRTTPRRHSFRQGCQHPRSPSIRAQSSWGQGCDVLPRVRPLCLPLVTVRQTSTMALRDAWLRPRCAHHRHRGQIDVRSRATFGGFGLNVHSNSIRSKQHETAPQA